MSKVVFEYAVRWSGDSNAVEEVPSRDQAVHLVNSYPQWDGEILIREVRVGDWRPER